MLPLMLVKKMGLPLLLLSVMPLFTLYLAEKIDGMQKGVECVVEGIFIDWLWCTREP